MVSWGGHHHDWHLLYSDGKYAYYECKCGATRTAPKGGR